MDFDLQWLLWGLPLAFALGWFGSRMDARQWRREQQDSPKVYYKGLNLLLNEQHDKAIDVEVVAVDSLAILVLGSAAVIGLVVVGVSALLASF